MNTWVRFKIVIALMSTVLVMHVLGRISDFVFRDVYVARPGYKVPGVSEPAVDLASLQRSWPAGLNAGPGRARVRDYMHNIEKVSIPRGQARPTPARPAPKLDLGTLLATADADKGRQSALVCASCHTFDRGGQDRTGPALWGVVGRDIASRPGFEYSGALAAQPGGWTYERLDQFLTNPAKTVPGSRMAFAGLRRPEDRANIIAFLSTMTPSPPPFPKPEPTQVTGAPSEPGGAG